MRKISSIHSQNLVFAKRKFGKISNRRERKKSILNRVIFILFFILLGILSIILGHFAAKNSSFPVLFENKTPEFVINPIVQKKSTSQSIEVMLEKSGISFESVSFATTSSALIITLEKDSFAYLDSNEDLSPQVKALETILKRVKIDNPGKKIQYIDLRFGKPTVKY